MGGNAVGSQRGARQFNHCADAILDRHSLFTHHLTGHLVDYQSLLTQFLTKRNQWDHDLKLDLFLLALHQAGGLKNSPALHACDFRKEQTQTAAAKSQHGVGFANADHLLEETSLFVNLIKQVVHVAQSCRQTHGHLELAKFVHQLFRVRQKFMQWWIKQADCYRQPGHLAKDANKVAALQWQ